MMKKIVSVSFLLLCVLLANACEKQGGAFDPNDSALQKDKEKPNVVFILADDLGWGDLSCYGHRQ